MNIQSANFIGSSAKKSQFPISDLPEYAFIGRSNVGKSSLINVLTNRKQIAKTSSAPGKTRLINHFLINEQWYLADLPGYGYAKVSKKERENFQKLISDYIDYRENLVCLFVLIDSRLSAQRIDLDFLKDLGKKQIPFCIVFTKIDKLSAQNCKENIKLYNVTLLKYWQELPRYFKSSASSKEGRIEILTYIEQLNREWKSSLTN